MSTMIRPELSEQNKYWIEKHRYYELKHFCLQYPIWKNAYIALLDLKGSSLNSTLLSKTNVIKDPTSKSAEARLFYSNRMNMIEKIAAATDATLSNYILKAVTEGISYDSLRTRFEIPCCKDTYYNLYRRFFWLLSIERQ